MRAQARFRRCVVEAPATTANLGPGFDVFGLALDVAYDRVELEVISDSGGVIEIQVDGPYASEVPADASRNTAAVAVSEVLRELGIDVGLRLKLWKGVRPRCGLGSSGSSAAAAVVAVAKLLQLDLPPVKLVEYAARGEAVAAGHPHADNVAPSILGGFTVIRSYRPLDVISLEPPPNLGIVLAIPKIPVPKEKTKFAREVLPKSIELSKLVHNVGHAVYIALGFALKDVDLIGKGMDDAVVEPARAKLIPGYYNVRKRALEAGASGVAISGAGPTMLAVVNLNRVDPKVVGRAMCEGFREVGVEAEYVVTRPSRGARVLVLE